MSTENQQFTLNISTQVEFSEDDGSARLSKEATALKSAQDMDGAIECLKKIRAIMLVSTTCNTAKAWSRLPKYLVDAGRFQEAIDECNWLLEDLPRRMDLEAHVGDDQYGGTAAQKKKDAKDRAVHQRKEFKAVLSSAKLHAKWAAAEAAKGSK